MATRIVIMPTSGVSGKTSAIASSKTAMTPNPSHTDKIMRSLHLRTRSARRQWSKPQPTVKQARQSPVHTNVK
ncbi:MAG: hypothetical protein ABG776_02430 [Cyanobacteria bacterium J06555_13]